MCADCIIQPLLKPTFWKYCAEIGLIENALRHNRGIGYGNEIMNALISGLRNGYRNGIIDGFANAPGNAVGK